MDFENSQTKKNISTAFSGESEAIARYLIFADYAKQQGQEEISALFKKMARNEIEHAKAWYRHLMGEPQDIIQNLTLAAKAENQEWKHIYPKFAEIAEQEGFQGISLLFERIASIECSHERLFFEALSTLLNEEEKTLETQTEPALEKDPSYYCLFCGYGSTNKEAVCPVCQATDSFCS